jgi:hypothetical protein
MFELWIKSVSFHLLLDSTAILNTFSIPSAFLCLTDIRLGVLIVFFIIHLSMVHNFYSCILWSNVWYYYSHISYFLIKEWIDEFLTWNSSEFGNLAKIRIPCEKIWRPDIVLYNKYWIQCLFNVCLTFKWVLFKCYSAIKVFEWETDFQVNSHLMKINQFYTNISSLLYCTFIRFFRSLFYFIYLFFEKSKKIIKK